MLQIWSMTPAEQLREALERDGARLRRLSLEHEELEGRFEEIHRQAHFGDWHDLEKSWPGFAKDLEEHLVFEEEELFPWFAAEAPEHAVIVERLKEEHEQIRRALEAFRLEIQLHVVRAETIDRFISALQAHAQTERQRFYPWLADKAQ
ncbi:MAG: hemerythrin domain-containing protein [Myxococcota bacterium]